MAMVINGRLVGSNRYRTMVSLPPPSWPGRGNSMFRGRTGSLKVRDRHCRIGISFRNSEQIWIARGFRQWIAVPGLSSAEDHEFMFFGWRVGSYVLELGRLAYRGQKAVEEALDAYECRMRQLVKDLGAFPAVFRFSKDHFQWLALYQCGNLSARFDPAAYPTCRKQDDNLKGNPQRRKPSGNCSPAEASQVEKAIARRFSTD